MKYEDFLANTKGEESAGNPIDGTFQCQGCNEQIDTAEWFMVEKILRWRCSQGHTSYIENFGL